MKSRDCTVCFTGHREIRHSHCERNLFEIVETLIGQGYRFFCTGGARGFDSLAARTVLTLKERYPQIHLILILPFDCQYEAEQGWSREEMEAYHQYKQKASEVLFEGDGYKRGIYHKRNRHLVDVSHICVAYQYKNKGGTAYTVNYAEKTGIQVLHITEYETTSL